MPTTPSLTPAATPELGYTISSPSASAQEAHYQHMTAHISAVNEASLASSLTPAPDFTGAETREYLQTASYGYTVSVPGYYTTESPTYAVQSNYWDAPRAQVYDAKSEIEALKAQVEELKSIVAILEENIEVKHSYV